jgi:hypothetical protein
LTIYPNPATNKLTISYDKLKSTGIQARVVDLSGNILMGQNIIQGFNQSTELDISEIQNGLYILNFIDTNDDNLNISTVKFVISREQGIHLNSRTILFKRLKRIVLFI